MTNENFKKKFALWKRDRSRTRWIASVMIFLFGVQSQSVEVTMLFYYKESFGLTFLQATFYYSVTNTLFATSELISGISLGRYIDKTGNLRLVFLANLIAVFIGNLIYCIPLHIWWVIFGQVLLGLNECLQTSVCGEFRRSYTNKELVKVLSWYEFLFAIGINIGPGLPILFAYVDFEIGWWKVNKYNMIQFLTAVITLCMFITSWFFVIDLSKELDKLGEDAVNLVRDSNKKVEKTDQNEEKRGKLLAWKSFINIDIMSLCCSYGMMRYAVSTGLAMATLYAVNIFHWQINALSMLHIIVGSSTYLIMFALVHFEWCTGKLAVFFNYIIGGILACATLATLLIPKVITINTHVSQVAFCACLLLAKCYIYFQAQSSGKVLLFNTVTHSNANTIDSLRAAFGCVFRIIAKATFYYFLLAPEYFAPPMVLFGLILIWILLYRRNIHLS